ncbi:pyridoxamine 5'-phosphate oxidase family protein [Saccharopolyspora sp. K220]|uniref:pyridoxamine 5'-phosphate oxidase family protein n=1 Tax=Saccharopolyspora soli TaxID=2926618 RepID=UPI001F562B61|nr:pyridoxamine 5'-phosphate oxidase family protein [Saccharopolyspora soli]MCI2417406.1 pyridoxamine 5'-phosphate oxidase family protein [Saccharopolyspora soli]
MDVMIVPEDLADLLLGWPDIHVDEQAFPLLTVDEDGFPHVALLSRAELDINADRSAILAVVASTQTRENIRRRGRATLIAVHGEVAHYAKLRTSTTTDQDGLLGCVFDLVWHKRDSLGIPLSPIGFQATAEIVEMEHWARTRSVLELLRTGTAER